MAGLSPAARGQKRGVLEMLKYPPSIVTNMGAHPAARAADAFSTYSGLALMGSIVGAFLVPFTVSGYGFIVTAVVVSAMIFLLATIAGFAAEEKSKALDGLRKAANQSITHGKSVSVSQYVDANVHYSWEPHSYVDNLSPKQQRWLMKRWEEEIERATQKEIAPAQTFSGQLDNMVTENRLRQVEYHRKALAELEEARANDVNSLEGFNRALNGTSEESQPKSKSGANRLWGLMGRSAS